MTAKKKFVGADSASMVADAVDKLHINVNQRFGAKRITRQSRQSNATGFYAASLAGPATSNTNWHCLTVAQRKFYGVELLFSNPTGSSITFDSIAVAATANPTTSKIVPNGGGAWLAGSAVTVSTTGTASNPGFETSGFLPLQSIPRADGGKYPAWMFRVFTTSGVPAYSDFSTAQRDYWDVENPNWHLWMASQGGGDFTSASQASFTSTTRTAICVPIGWRLYYDTPGVTVLNISDSIMGGDIAETNTPVRQSTGYRGSRILQDEGVPVTFVNCGQSGNTIAQFAARATAAITFYRPDIVVLPVWTPNNLSNTQANFDTQWCLIMQIADLALSTGAQVVLVTPTPYNGFNAAQDGYRLLQRDRAMASGFAVVDVEPIVSDRASPAKWISGYSGDGTHPLAIANRAMAVEWANVIRSML